MSAILLAAAPYLGGTGDRWGYPPTRADRVHVAYPSRGVPLAVASTAAERIINCSTLTASILTAAYPDRPWGRQEYGDLQVFADRLPSRPNAPIMAAVRMRVAVAVDLLPDGWSLVQGWRRFSPTPSGHAVLVLRDGARALVLESTSQALLGPRLRETTPEALRSEFSAGLYVGRLLPR